MRQISILHRIIISVAVAVTFIGATATYFVSANYDSQVNERRNELVRQVEIIISLVVATRKLAEAAGKSPEDADKSAFRQIEALQFGNNNYFHIYEGTVVRYHGGMPHLIGKDLKNVKDTTGQFLVRRTAEEVAAKGESSFLYTWPRKGAKESIPKLGYNKRIPGTNYWVGTGVYIDDLDAVFWKGMDQALIVTLVLTALLAFVSFAISRSITHPLFLVRARMIGLAEGDSHSPVPETHARDEVGEMARAVEVFRKNKKYAHELELINTQIEKEALHDPLTGLANRRYFESCFKSFQDQCRDDGKRMALFHVDLDRFKEINDTMGHDAGDQVLKHAAEVLKENARRDDFIARIGGDEFLILGVYPDDGQSVEQTASGIVNALSEPLPYEGRLCRFGASIGVAVCSKCNMELDAFIKRADMALYRAKDLGRNRFEIFSRELETEIMNRNRTVEEFLDGLDLGQLSPWYQPRFDINTLDIVGIEVLARWIHPEKGVLKPETFLDIAEDQKVLAKINQSIVLQAMRDCIRLVGTGMKIPGISVNFTLDSLDDPELCGWFERLMPFPVRLSIELGETISFEQKSDAVAGNLERIRDMGIEIEIDDFGSGHASILGLLQVRPDRLKIDQYLVGPVTTSDKHRKLVQSIVDMGRSVGIPTVAEGVETLEHLKLLRSMGVNSFQGYAVAAPMRFSDLEEFLDTEAWRKVA